MNVYENNGNWIKTTFSGRIWPHPIWFTTKPTMAVSTRRFLTAVKNDQAVKSILKTPTSRFFWSKSNIFLIYVSTDPHNSCDHFRIKISVVGWSCVGGEREKLTKKCNKLQLFSDDTSMTSLSLIIPHMKALDLKFCIVSRLSLSTTWWRYRAIRKKSKNGFSATPSRRILMKYTLKKRKFYCDSNYACIMTFWKGQMLVKAHNQGQIGQISRNIPNIHMFRLRILSRI